MSPEVAADAAEPQGVVTLAAVLAEAMALAAVSSEVVAYAAEPPEAAVLVSSSCMVVAPKNVLSTCHVAVKKTVTEHYLSPGVTTVEPPEVAASAAEPPEVSGVPSCESLFCPVTAMEAVNESSSCPVTAMEAVCESLSCPVTGTEAAFEHMPCSEPANVSDSELPVPVKEYTPELSVMDSETRNALYVCPVNPVTTIETIHELSSSPVPKKRPVTCPISTVVSSESNIELPVLSPETINTLHVCPVTPVISKELTYELSSRPVSVSEPVDECFVFPATVPETMNALPVLSVSALPVLSVSVLPRSRSPPWFPGQSVLVFRPVYSAMVVFHSGLVVFCSSLVVLCSAVVFYSGLAVLCSAVGEFCSGPVVFCSAVENVCSALVGSSPVRSALVGSSPVRSALVGSSPVCSALVGSSPVCSTLVGSRPVRSALVGSSSVDSILASCSADFVSVHSPYTSTWTWASVPPPVPPLLHCPPGLYRSVWKPLFGGGYVTNPVHALPFTHHQRSLVHHIDSYTTLLLPFTIELHFPSSTALTQLFALITLTPENYLTITITQSHTLYKPGTSSRITPSIVCPATLQSVYSLPR